MGKSLLAVLRHRLLVHKHLGLSYGFLKAAEPILLRDQRPTNPEGPGLSIVGAGENFSAPSHPRRWAPHGRIDDPAAGWKGRGLWVTSGNRTPMHIEGLNSLTPGAPGTTLATQSSPLVVHFQLRPDPLAH
jgi:hypothetical protein